MVHFVIAVLLAQLNLTKLRRVKSPLLALGLGLWVSVVSPAVSLKLHVRILHFWVVYFLLSADRHSENNLRLASYGPPLRSPSASAGLVSFFGLSGTRY